LVDEPQSGQRLAQIRLAEIERLDRCRRELGTRLWVPHNLGDTLTAPTPLTWDAVRWLTSGRGAFGRLYRSLGYAPSRRVCEHGFLELIAGRIYADPDRLVEMFCDGWPLGYDAAALRANPRLIDRSPTCFAPERTDALWLFRLPAILWTMLRAARRLRSEATHAAERFDQQTLPDFRAYVERERARPLRELPDCDLVGVLDDRCRQVLDEFGAEFLRPGLFAGLAVTALETRLVSLLGPEDGSRCVRTLVSGLETDADAAPEAWFHRLAQGQIGLSEFLEGCGHRGPNEFELAAGRWREIPDQAVRWANWLRESAAADPAELRARAAHDRIRAMRLLPETLRAAGAGSFAGRVVEEAEAAQRLLPYRERARHYWLMGYGLIRDAVQEIARRSGLDDGIFFLKLEEIRQFPSAADAWREVIGDRRQQWQWQQRLTAPDVIESTNLDAIGNADFSTPAAVGTRLEAISLSPGVAQGPVWILNTSRPATAVRNGFVLVCSSLDPGLVPLMLAACAVVVERGGMLSHGAIVARQIGLPVVVVSQATRLLHDGQVVVVDAGRGCVLCPAEGKP
jgi:pyruvate,water dikinase